MANEWVQIGAHTFELESAMRGGLRWAVSTPDGPRSSIWRLWGNKKGDVYLSVRSLGGVLKASFHRDRRCQVGFTSNYTETAIQRFGARSRHWERWVLPEAPTVRAVQIVVPANELVPFGANDASHQYSSLSRHRQLIGLAQRVAVKCSASWYAKSGHVGSLL
jgi:hypothetical protein